MTSELFIRRSRIAAPAEEVFRWHTRPGALERLTPPWEHVRVLERTGGVDNGGRVVLRIRFGPLRRTWVAQHCDYLPGQQFRDVQVRGPFARWEHLHRIEPDGPNACFLVDRIDYALPLGTLGQRLGRRLVRRKLAQMFAYRHRVTADDLAQPSRQKGGTPMRILVSGSTGLVGSALVPLLTSGGHEVVRLVRGAPQPGARDIHWDPDAGKLDEAALEGIDAVVHLAGESIASGRWTAAKKTRIRDSRVRGTRLLSEALARRQQPPRVLVSASAIGYYGDRGEELLTEDSPVGTGFLAEVCRDWEQATEPAAAKGIRVVNLRFGVILTPAGGALAKMLFPFRMGVGGKIGSGRQYTSWIALDDAIGAVQHALVNEAVRGPVNGVAPRPVTNLEFTKTLGRVLGRPTIFPMPAFAARLAFGEMAQELLLAGARVEPARLGQTGYRFRYPDLEGALRHLLGKVPLEQSTAPAEGS